MFTQPGILEVAAARRRSARLKQTLAAIGGLMMATSAAASGTVAIGGIQDGQIATRSNGDHVFLSNSLIEVGSRPNGAYSSDACNTPAPDRPDFAPPAGYHPRNDQYADCKANDGKFYGLGFRAVNPVDKDWSAPTFGDFFNPGIPYEGFAIGYGGNNYRNNHLVTQVTGGAWASASYVPGTGATATWSGGTAGVISVTQVSSIPESGYMLHTDVTLLNTSGSAIGPVYYFRGLDPDNCATNLGTDCEYYYDTYNTVHYSNDPSLGSRVGAWQTDGSYIALMTSFADSKVIIGGNNRYFCDGYFDASIDTRSVAGLYDGTNPCMRTPESYAGGVLGYPGVFGDNDYGVVLNIGTLAPGESKTFRVTYLLLAPPPAGTISATGGNAQATAVWTAPTGKFAPLTGYVLEYSTSSSGPWTAGSGSCALATTGTSTGLSCTQPGLTNGTKYYFRVAAINESGAGAFTTPAEATPSAPPPVVCEGFFAPVDRSPTVNRANAGRTIPLKWRCTNNGVPVTTQPSDFRVTAEACSAPAASSSLLDAIEEYSSGKSGLISQSNGSWQFNWATPKSYANSCRTVVVTFSGVRISADFRFVR